jgi:hypothetical protein
VIIVLGLVVAVGFVMRFWRPRSVFAWVNLVVLGVSVLLWALWGSGGRLAVARRRFVTWLIPDRLWRDALRGSLYDLVILPAGCLGFLLLPVLNGVLLWGTHGSGPSADPSGYGLLVLGTPLAIVLMLADATRSAPWHRPGQGRGRSERTLAAVARVVQRHLELGEPDVEDAVRRHPTLQRLGPARIGGEAGRLHLEHVAAHDGSEARRLAAQLILDKLARRRG